MKKVNQLLTDYRVLVYIITIIGIAISYVKLPQRVDAIETNVKNTKAELTFKIEEVKEEVENTEDNVQKLAHTVDKYISNQSIKEEFWEKSEIRQEALLEKIVEVTTKLN